MTSATSIDELTLADLVPIIDSALISEESAADELLRQKDTRTGSHLYEDASRRIDEFCHDSPYREAWACRPGCYACCFQSVPVTAIEALTVAEFLQTDAPPQALPDAKGRLEANAQHYAALSPREFGYTRIRCAFLDEDGKCSVHPARPLRCRGYHSLCAERCESMHHGDCDVIVPVDPQTNVAMRGVQSGLSGALRKRGKDGRYYELNSAVRRALETPNAWKRWERGEDIFAGCTPPSAQPDDLWIAPQEDGSIVKLRRRENQQRNPEIELVHIRTEDVCQEPVWHVASKEAPTSPDTAAPTECNTSNSSDVVVTAGC